MHPSAVSKESMAAYERAIAARGGDPNNLFRAMAPSPSALEHVAALGEFVRFGSSLAPALREVVILCVADEAECRYEWVHHRRIAREVHVPEPVLTEVMRRTDAAQLGRFAPAARLARAMTRGAAVDVETLATLTQDLGAKGLVDLMVTIGYYTLLSRIINGMGIALEPNVHDDGSWEQRGSGRTG